MHLILISIFRKIIILDKMISLYHNIMAYLLLIIVGIVKKK